MPLYFTQGEIRRVIDDNYSKVGMTRDVSLCMSFETEVCGLKLWLNSQSSRKNDWGSSRAFMRSLQTHRLNELEGRKC